MKKYTEEALRSYADSDILLKERKLTKIGKLIGHTRRFFNNFKNQTFLAAIRLYTNYIKDILKEKAKASVEKLDYLAKEAQLHFGA